MENLPEKQEIKKKKTGRRNLLGKDLEALKSLAVLEHLTAYNTGAEVEERILMHLDTTKSENCNFSPYHLWKHRSRKIQPPRVCQWDQEDSGYSRLCTV